MDATCEFGRFSKSVKRKRSFDKKEREREREKRRRSLFLTRASLRTRSIGSRHLRPAVSLSSFSLSLSSLSLSLESLSSFPSKDLETLHRSLCVSLSLSRERLFPERSPSYTHPQTVVGRWRSLLEVLGAELLELCARDLRFERAVRHLEVAPSPIRSVSQPTRAARVGYFQIIPRRKVRTRDSQNAHRIGRSPTDAESETEHCRSRPRERERERETRRLFENGNRNETHSRHFFFPMKTRLGQTDRSRAPRSRWWPARPLDGGDVRFLRRVSAGSLIETPIEGGAESH